MPLIIDGYNLLNAVGIIGRGIGPGGLERARLALLNFLAESLEPEEIPKTTVVFDSREAPWGLPRTVSHRGISVQFASKYPDAGERETGAEPITVGNRKKGGGEAPVPVFPDADALIEYLILKESSPRKLTVVSSDHRLQRAAKRRRARAIDSDVWYAEMLRARRERQESSKDKKPDRPPVPLLAEEVEYWLDQFGGEATLDEWVKQQAKLAKSEKKGP